MVRRSLRHIRCYCCDAGKKADYTVRHIEEPRPITKEDAGSHFDEFEGMKVADAICTRCRTEYLAWVEPAPGKEKTKSVNVSVYGHFDLSYRRSFSDEPGKGDVGIENVKANDDGTLTFPSEMDRALRQQRAAEQMREEITNRIGNLESEQVEMVLDVLHNPEQYRSLVELIDRVSGSDTMAPWRNR